MPERANVAVVAAVLEALVTSLEARDRILATQFLLAVEAWWPQRVYPHSSTPKSSTEAIRAWYTTFILLADSPQVCP